MNKKVMEKIASAARLFFFLDYDGTLTPIVARPAMAKLALHHKLILLNLSKQKNTRMAIISGRGLEDIKHRVGIPGIIYAGNHGLEIEGIRMKGVHPSALAFKSIVKKLIHRLEHAYAFFPEVLVEDKTYSVSVHYRQAPEEKIDFLKMILLREVGDFLSNSQLVLAEGKKVWEIRPPTEWHKGRTALWLLGRVVSKAEKNVLPVYIGDDITDEDGFKAIKKNGITIRVTDKTSEPTEAQYGLHSSDEVFVFLKEVMKLRRENAL
ncbi:MAG TPA: trehalose-phosphatase [Candidatus Omnitrophota bacterium]|nr:trehalose-phosphatase [Candidatus Omnitrophota bacterium]